METTWITLLLALVFIIWILFQRGFWVMAFATATVAALFAMTLCILQANIVGAIAFLFVLTICLAGAVRIASGQRDL